MSMNEPKYPHAVVEIDETDGNPFGVVCAVANALRTHGVPEHEVDAFRTEALSGDYDKVLQTAMSWIQFR